AWGGAQITPKAGKLDEVYNQLSKVKNIKVYKRDDIPEKFHYKHNSLVLPILVTADVGYEIQPPKIDGVVLPGGYTKPSKPSGGNHGYNVSELTDMRGIMYGFGPALKKNYTAESLEMVDHYNLFCHILGINPIPNNGTDSKAREMLVSSGDNS
ncbi:unnamed protein product, partial [Medioppia subpectinata]